MAGTFSERAQRVQDEIGWADVNNAVEMGQATLHLAQLVRDIAVEVDRISGNLTEAAKILREVADEPTIEDI